MPLRLKHTRTVDSLQHEAINSLPDIWLKPESQQRRAGIIFEFYPELKKAYDLAMDLTDILN